MGQRVKTNKLDVQKARLKSVFNNLIESTKSILEFQLTITSNNEEIKGIKNLIKKCDKCHEIINSVNHIEILISLYNSFISQKESYYVVLCSTIANKNTIIKWDRTQKGFKEFVELENQARAKSKQEFEEKQKQQELIEKAKKDGKKIEFAYENGKLKPIIVGDKPN